MKARMNRLSEEVDESIAGVWSSFTVGWQLAKVPLCLLISCSACFGAILAGRTAPFDVLYVSLSVFLLAMGGATINSAQEAVVDGEMKRTAHRPLVRQAVSREFAVCLAIILVGLALIMLSQVYRPVVCVSLGISALILYNAVYTPLKKETIFAIFPGAVCGAIPPLIGYFSAAGAPFSYTSLLLFMLLFLWQVPHFYLVLLRHKDDYLQSNLPSFIKTLSEKGVKQLSYVWICGLALVMMLFSVTGGINQAGLKYLVVFNALLLVVIAGYNLVLRESPAYRSLFVCLNIMLLVHMITVGVGNYYL